MRRELASLESEEFDLLVIGGGIFGACAARDAALRGLSVALIDRADFCAATSANSYKLVHGGIRYLQHLDLARLRQSSRARRTLLRTAPHLVQPLPVVVPTYGHGMKGKEALRAGMALYDALTLDRNAGVRDPDCHVPRGRTLSRDAVLERYPGLPSERLTGGAVLHDGQMYNPPRLVLAFVRGAAEEGAAVANYVEAERFVTRGERVVGVTARDTLDGGKLDIRARSVLNAAGPYAEGLLERGLGRGLERETPWSRDAYFVVNRTLVPGRSALALPATTRDPEALLSRGERHLFLVPWHDHTLVGVWHASYRGDPDSYSVSEAELEAFIAEINAAYRGLDLGLGDLSLWNAGLIPFGENEPDSADLAFGHRSRLVDHAIERGLEGLVTLIGVRYTTAPCEAVEAVDLILRKLGRTQASRSDTTPVFGGDLESFEMLVEHAIAEAPDGVAPASLRTLAHNHGTACHHVLRLAYEHPELAEPIGTSLVLKAEIVYAAREEMAVALGDAVCRRTDLGTERFPGRHALEVAAALMQRELGWSASETNRQIETVEASYPVELRAR
jgi:glycerol-3-phosphate dehydrogenase